MPYYNKGKSKNGLKRYVVSVNYMNALGEYKNTTKVVYGLEQAKEAERQLEVEVKEFDKVRSKMTLQQLFDKYMDSRQTATRESTLDKNRREWRLYIKDTMGKVKIQKLTVQVLESWKMSVDKMALALQTKRHAYNLFRQILNYGVKMDYIGKNHLLKIGTFKDAMYKKSKIEFYTDVEFLQYIKIAKQQAEEQERNGNLGEWDYYVFFNILFYTGVRKGECHGFEWTDIDGEYLEIERSVAQKLKNEDVETPPKNESSIRTLRMPQPLIEILRQHKARKMRLHNFNDSDKICSKNGRSLRDSTVDSKNRKYAELSGLNKRIRIHDFRHSHVSALIHYGVSIHEISRRVGHAKIEITLNTYGHLYKNVEDTAIEVLNKIA